MCGSTTCGPRFKVGHCRLRVTSRPVCGAPAGAHRCTGYVDIPHSLTRKRLLLTEDVNTIRRRTTPSSTTSAAPRGATADDGIERLRLLLREEARYAPVLAGFEVIDQGRRVLEDETASVAARRAADHSTLGGTVQLLEHEQRALVQPNFDRLSCAFARLVSIGATTKLRGARRAAGSRLLHLLLPALAHPRHPGTLCVRRRGRGSPVSTAGVGSRGVSFLELPEHAATSCSIGASLRRIADEARDYASIPCVLLDRKRRVRAERPAITPDEPDVDQARSKRSRVMTFSQAATKSRTNLSVASPAA